MTTASAKIQLDVIRVIDPCDESWAAMRGDDRVRFCGVCRENVYSLSAMTREEATALLVEREGKLCARFYRRADGTVSTIDCAPARFARARRAARRTMLGAATLLVSLLGLVASLSLFRLSGLDISSWLEDTAVAQLAKKGKELVAAIPEEEEHETMGTPGWDEEPLPIQGGVRLEPHDPMQ